MPDERRKHRFALKTVFVGLPNAQLLDKEPVFLFSARQIEEVLPAAKVKVQPLPFAPDWLLGLCAWQQKTLSVIDMASLYGITCTPERHFYLVVRVITSTETTDSLQQEKQLLRCVLKVPDQITASEVSNDCRPITAEQLGIAPALIKGIFMLENRLFILPELRPVLCTPAVV